MFLFEKNLIVKPLPFNQFNFLHFSKQISFILLVSRCRLQLMLSQKSHWVYNYLKSKNINPFPAARYFKKTNTKQIADKLVLTTNLSLLMCLIISLVPQIFKWNLYLGSTNFWHLLILTFFNFFDLFNF